MGIRPGLRKGGFQLIQHYHANKEMIRVLYCRIQISQQIYHNVLWPIAQEWIDESRHFVGR